MNNSSEKLNIGDILESKWGYGQTNVDYYEVRALTPKGVKIQQIKSDRVYTDSMCGSCIPVRGMYIGIEMKKLVKSIPNGTKYLQLTSFSTAWKWNGLPNFFSEWY
jgi:hypothetical protein